MFPHRHYASMLMHIHGYICRWELCILLNITPILFEVTLPRRIRSVFLYTYMYTCTENTQ